MHDNYAEPSHLVIATNNEGSALRYYLDCIVIIDSFSLRLPQDFMYQPDMIVPRPSGRGQRQLGQLAVRTAYDQEDLPVSLLRWMTDWRCRLGLGDGLGLNYITPDEATARLLERLAAEEGRKGHEPES